MIELKEVGSTNEYIKEHVNELDNIECVFTSNQTKGKGRTGHTWESEPNKNAAFSILIKDDKIIEKFNLISIVTSVVVAEYLQNLGINEVSIKWPNDVYIASKKVCGILLEGSLPNYMIIGVGINVNQKDFNGFSATSIKNVIGMKIDPKLVAIDVSDALKYSIQNLKDDLSDYIEEYTELDYLLNKTISFNYNGEFLQGIAKGIDFDGSLKVMCNNKLINVSSNEVNLVRKK
jgi:BirA family biotin operon repressor/biotin-[acetyl-CoA-carboxylase] ligase